MESNNRSVLLAEDDENDRFLMVIAFKEVGIDGRLKTVHDGQQAIDYFSGPADDGKKEPPKLLILDVNMPRKGGFEVLQWLRSSEKWKLLPVIVLSSSSRPDDVARAYDLGACAYVVKPTSLSELIDLVASIQAFWLRFAEVPYSAER